MYLGDNAILKVKENNKDYYSYNFEMISSNMAIRIQTTMKLSDLKRLKTMIESLITISELEGNL